MSMREELLLMGEGDNDTQTPTIRAVTFRQILSKGSVVTAVKNSTPLGSVIDRTIEE